MPLASITDPILVGRPFFLQFTLYFASALTFALIALIFRLGKSPSMWEHYQSAGGAPAAILASVFSALAIFCSFFEYPWQIIIYVCLGASHAGFITSTLIRPQFFKRKTDCYRSTMINIVLGSLIAIAVVAIIEPLSSVLLCLLPLGALAINHLGHSNESRVFVPGHNNPRRYPDTKLSEIFIHSGIFAFAFGLCQGGLSVPGLQEGTRVLTSGGISLPIGAFVAATILFLLPKKDTGKRSPVVFLRWATPFMVIGGLIAIMAEGSTTLSTEDYQLYCLIAQSVLFMGLCLFSYGALSILIYVTGTEEALFAYAPFNRFAVNFGLALGLSCGCAAINSPILTSNSSIIIIGFAVLLVSLFSLPLFDRFLPTLNAQKTGYSKTTNVDTYSSSSKTTQNDINQRSSKEKDTALFEDSINESVPVVIEEDVHTDRWIDNLNAIATQNNLSKREQEIFCYLAKGRNASFIHQELNISVHTVKTHIANIYAKVDAHSIQDIIDLVENYDTEKLSIHGTIGSEEDSGKEVHAGI